MSGYLNQHYRKTRTSTFQGLRIVSHDRWLAMSGRDKTRLLEYLPDRAVLWCESTVWGLPGFENWLITYHNYMISRNDAEFVKWSAKGEEAWAWEMIRLLIEVEGDWKKVRAEEKRRREARLCAAAGGDKSRGLLARENGSSKSTTTARNTRTSPKKNGPVPEMVEQERRRNEHLCANCGSPKVVMRSDWDSSPIEYYCAEEPMVKSILSSSPDCHTKQLPSVSLTKRLEESSVNS